MLNILSRQKSCMFSFLKVKSQINRFVCYHSRLNFTKLVTVRPLLVTHYQFFKKTEVSFSGNITDNKPKSITTAVEYEDISEETLQSIGDRFEELLEDSDLSEWDVNYSNDVLTVTLDKHGTYVINKQSPNKQIWLSSPISGPKRYDYDCGSWIYKHDGKSLHQLLSEEFSSIVGKETNFMNCAYSKEN